MVNILYTNILIQLPTIELLDNLIIDTVRGVLRGAKATISSNSAPIALNVQ